MKILLYYTPFDPRTSTSSSTPGWNGSATSAARTTCRSSSSSSATKKARTRRAWSTRRRSRKSSGAAWREFTKDRYGVDVMKVEMPINMKFVEGAKAFGNRAGGIPATRPSRSSSTRPRQPPQPFIYLSAGVSNPEFTEALAAGRRVGRALFRRALRPGDVAMICLRRRRGVPRVAGERGQEHRERQRAFQPAQNGSSR